MSEQASEIWSGLSKDYENYRPELPEKLIGLLSAYSAPRVPELVVDLGSGTGKSSRAWQGKAKSIVGIEPSKEMISMARLQTHAPEVHYVHARAEQTGLPDQCADYIVVSSAIHWMEPDATLREVKRVLKPEGIFAFWGSTLPPVSPFLELDQAYFYFKHTLESRFLLSEPTPRWAWDETLECIRRNKCFRIHRYFHFDQSLQWNAVNYINWLGTTLPDNYRREEQAFTDLLKGFCEQVHKVLGNEKHAMFFNYPVHVFTS
jgi:SAM-dependent methyltransferase